MRLYSLMGQFDKAWEQYQKAKEIDPDFINQSIFVFYWRQGKYKEALEIIEKGGDFSARQWVIGVTYALSGDREKAEEILNELIERKKEEYVPCLFIAVIYGALGDNDNCFSWLERAYDERDAWLPLINTEPGFDKMRSDPRYSAFLRKMGLPED